MSTFMRLSTFSFLFVSLASSIAACSSSNDDDPVKQPPRPDGGTDSGIVRGTDAGTDGGDEKPDGSGGGGGGGGEREKIVKACTDLGDAFAKAYARCGVLEYQEVYDLYMSRVGGPSCPNVVSIRNESELRGQCIPWYGTVSCSELESSTVHSSCQGQLQVRENLSEGSLAPQGTTPRSTLPLLQGLVDER